MITALAIVFGVFVLWTFFKIIISPIRIMRFPPMPVLELPMEKSFELRKIQIEVEECQDINQLKEYTKELIKMNMLLNINISNLVKGYHD